jgi:ABC-type dipeptide/oligopeptide/nickel transport system permease component
MKRFVVKHLLFMLLTLFAVSLLVFTLNEFSPGAVARKILGAYATQEQVDLLTTQMGLDRPVLVRYVDYLGALASGDLGYSTRFKLPVRDVIFKHLANTALLAALAFACIVPLSTVLGVVAGMREASRLDRAILMFPRWSRRSQPRRLPGQRVRRLAGLAAGRRPCSPGAAGRWRRSSCCRSPSSCCSTRATSSA